MSPQAPRTISTKSPSCTPLPSSLVPPFELCPFRIAYSPCSPIIMNISILYLSSSIKILSCLLSILKTCLSNENHTVLIISVIANPHYKNPVIHLFNFPMLLTPSILNRNYYINILYLYSNNLLLTIMKTPLFNFIKHKLKSFILFTQ